MNDNKIVHLSDHKKSKSAKMGNRGGGGDMSDLNIRVAKIEAEVCHIQKDIVEIKQDLRALDTKIDSNFKWLISIFLMSFITSFGGLALIMAHGFHWL